jgi:hypothetical protein
MFGKLYLFCGECFFKTIYLVFRGGGMEESGLNATGI